MVIELQYFLSSHRSWYCLWTTISDILLACTLSCHIHSAHSFKHIQDKQYSRMHISACSFSFFFLLRGVVRSCHTLPQWEEQEPVAGWESKIILPVPSVKHVGYIGSRSECPSPSFLCASISRFTTKSCFTIEERDVLHKQGNPPSD